MFGALGQSRCSSTALTLPWVHTTVVIGKMLVLAVSTHVKTTDHELPTFLHNLINLESNVGNLCFRKSLFSRLSSSNNYHGLPHWLVFASIMHMNQCNTSGVVHHFDFTGKICVSSTYGTLNSSLETVRYSSPKVSMDIKVWQGLDVCNFNFYIRGFLRPCYINNTNELTNSC